MDHFNGYSVSPLVLIQQGKSRFTIVTRAKPDAAEQFAAEELRRYLGEMTAVQLPIKSDVEWRGGPCLSVGLTEQARSAQRAPRPRWPEDDAYAIRADRETVSLLGCRPRGTLFAVYDFLRRLGCRWFAPGFRCYRGAHEFVPRQADVVLDAPLEILEQPDFRYRGEYPEHSYAHEPDDVVALMDWCAKNRINWMSVRQNELSEPWRRVLEPERAKRDLMLSSSGHGYDRFLPRTKYFRKHRDWFGPIDGQYSDRFFDQFRVNHPEALRTFLENLRDFVQQFPNLHSISSSANDSPKWADEDRSQDPAQLLFHMHERIVKTVHEANPNVKVSISTGVAYFGATGENTFESSYPNVIYNTSVLRRSLRYAWCDPRSEVNRPQYELAAAATKKLAAKGHVVTWSSRYSSFRDISLPGTIYPHQMAEELRDLKQIGGAGVNYSYAQPPAWIPAELKHYLYARLLWNATEPVEEIMDQYYRDRFPGSAAEIKGFYTALRRGMERYEHPGGGYTREGLYGLYPQEEFEDGFKDMKEAQELLDQAMRANPDEDQRQLIWLLNASLQWGKGKMEMDFLAQTNQLEKAAGRAKELMDFIEELDGKGVIYDSVFLRKAVEYRFTGFRPNRPIKKRPIENDRLYEYKDYLPGARRRAMPPA